MRAPPSNRPPRAALGAGALLVVSAVAWLVVKGASPPTRATSVAIAPAASQGPAGADQAQTVPTPATAPTAPASAPGDAAPPDPGGDEAPRHPVNLDKLRAKMPDNTYWRLSAPTDDPAALRARAEEERRTNELYGKVLSNTASEEEIRNYYAGRRRVSEDYIEFAATVLKDYGDELPDQERGLYELSINMHRRKLGEIPRQIDDALARKQVQDRRRQEWQGGPPR